MKFCFLKLCKFFNFFSPSKTHHREDFLTAISEAEAHCLIDADAAKMIKGVMEVSDMTVSDIMIPRSQMVMINLNSSLAETLPLIIQSSHSRFPVVDDEDKDNIIGILHAKDILKYLIDDDFSHIKIQAHMLRSAAFIPESKRLDSLLKEFRLSRNHLAMVIDEYGSLSGLVTIEDVLEQIVGEIEDEFDKKEDAMIKPCGPHLFEINALTSIEEFNLHFGSHYSDELVDTMGGLILLTLGHVPEQGTVFMLDSFEVQIIEADTRHIIRMTIKTSTGTPGA